MRKLATVRRISEIKPIDGADKIEVAVVDGWECVISKNDAFKAGDLVVYIEVDSIVPERPEFEFLRDRKFRVRTIKLRKQISQGLIVHLDILPERIAKKAKEDMDVTDVLGIKKYDPQAEKEISDTMSSLKKSKNPFIRFLMRFKIFRKFYIKPNKSNFPSWIKKTDEERVQNLSRKYEEWKNSGIRFSVTEKIDGCSATYFVDKTSEKTDFGVCSRNLRIEKDNGGHYWKIAKDFDIKSVLESLCDKLNVKRIVLQGEILGEGIQGNKYNISGFDFYAYNLIADGKKFETSEISNILNEYKIKTVSILYSDTILPETIKDIVELSSGKAILNNKIEREGVVCRNTENDISFKVINPRFLLQNGE